MALNPAFTFYDISDHCIRFSGAAVRDCHKPGGSQQHKWTLTVQEARSPTSGCGQGPAPCRGARGGSFLPLSSFQRPVPRGRAPPASASSSPFFSGHLSLALGPAQIIQGGLISSPLITSVKTLFPNKVIYKFEGLGSDILGGHCSAHYTFLLYISYVAVYTQWMLYKCFFN